MYIYIYILYKNIYIYIVITCHPEAFGFSLLRSLIKLSCPRGSDHAPTSSASTSAVRLHGGDVPVSPPPQPTDEHRCVEAPVLQKNRFSEERSKTRKSPIYGLSMDIIWIIHRLTIDYRQNIKTS